MLITCKKCQSTYSLSNQIIGKDGRKVKCARCSNIWTATPEEEEPFNLDACVSPEPNTGAIDSSKPEEAHISVTASPDTNESTLQTTPSSLCKLKHSLFILIPISLIIAILYISIISFPEVFIKILPLKNTFEKHNIYHSNKDITLDNVSHKIINGDLVITGKLVNHSNENKSIPNLNYTLLDKSEKVIFNATEKVMNKKIKANHTSDIYTKITNISGDAAYLELTVGSKLNLLFSVKK